MSDFIPRRRLRMEGVASLFDLALRGWRSDRSTGRIPTSARLRRDIGLPALEDMPALRDPRGTKI